MKRMIRTLALAFVATISFSAVKAQKFQSVSWTANGNNIHITGVVTGLGNVTKFGKQITVSFDYTIDGSCENKNGNEISAFTCSGSGEGTFPVTVEKNGRYDFDATVDMTPYLESADCKKKLCPNGLVGGAVYTITNLNVTKQSIARK